MFDTSERSTGTQYTTTVALLVMGCVFTPAVLLLSRPVEALTIWVAVGCSAVYLLSSRLSWTRYSRLTIPSIAGRRGRSK